MYKQDELLPVSVLQHILFCERQCAFIHVEQIWLENYFTAAGQIVHEKGVGNKTLLHSANLAVEFPFYL